MQLFLAAALYSAQVSFSPVPATIMVADCSKTVMGGGCGVELDAGVAPHMRAQSQAATIPAKAKSAAPVKDAAAQKPVKVSDTPSQKSKI